MQDADPRMAALLHHLRAALEAWEQIMLQPHRPVMKTTNEKASDVPRPVASTLAPARHQKLSHTVKEVRTLTGIGHSTLYRAMGNGDLRAVKLGKKTLILAKDLQDWLDGLPELRHGAPKDAR